MRMLFSIVFLIGLTGFQDLNAQSVTYGLDIRGDDTLLCFTVDDPSDLEFKRDASSSPSINCYAMDFDPSGENLLAFDNATSSIGTLNLDDGSFSAIAAVIGDYDTADIPSGITFDSMNSLVFLSTVDELFILDPSTGATSRVGAFSGSDPNTGDPVGFMIDIAVNNSGQMYGHDITNDCLWSIDSSSGACAFVGYSGFNANFAQGMDFDPATDLLYAAIYTGAGTGSYGTWDTSTGDWNEIERLELFPDPDGDGMEMEIAIRETAITLLAESIAVTRGQYVDGGTAEVASSDNVDYQARRGSSDIQARVDLEVIATSPTQNPSEFRLTVEGSVFSRSGVNQTIQFFDYDAGTYVTIDTQASTRFADSVHDGIGTGDLARFVDDTTGEVKARIRFLATAARSQFSTNTDQILWQLR